MRRLLLAHPELRGREAALREALDRIHADAEVWQIWQQVAAQPIVDDADLDEAY